MAHKSKTQRQKAAVAKQNRKDRAEREEAAALAKAAEGGADAPAGDSKPKAESKPAKQQVAAAVKKETKKEDKPKKVRFQFLHDVRAEMKRVTWPTRTDVLRWSGVVVGALVFFGVYTAVLDNVIITPALVALTGLGA